MDNVDVIDRVLENKQSPSADGATFYFTYIQYLL